MHDTPTAHRRLLAPGAILVGAAVLLLLLFGNSGRQRLDVGRTAFMPAFLPIYEIEAVSGSHHASILNLPLPYVGAPQVPVPVDINGDLLPDVTFAVNLVNAEGVFNNPPDLGEVIAPNIDINRLFTAPILTPGGDPLRINMKFTVFDLSGENPDIVVRYGYDTGPGGSIPPSYKALVAGLDTLFNPITARVDVTGGLLIGIDPHLPDLGLSPQTAAYEGPLTTFAALDTGPALEVNADLRFKPVPQLLEFTYGTEDATQQITVAHTSTAEVDFTVDGHVRLGAEDIDADLHAGIDRLPREIVVDFATAGDEGAVRYESDSGNGRLPDLRASIDMRQGDERPLIARVDMESLPDLITAQWNLPDGQPPSVEFDSSGQGIGAVEARIQNYTGAPTAFTPWVPGERQHVSIQAGPEGVFEGDTLIQARVERIRAATVGGTPEGNIAGHVEIGDGERPLEVHGEVDLRPSGLPYINATATISLLPDRIDFELTPIKAPVEGADPEPEQPMSVYFAPSESMDVDVSALIGLPETEGTVACGDPGTACADLQIRNVPTSIRANVVDHESESRLEIDAVPRPGASPLDVFGQVVLGPVDADLGPATSLLAEPIYGEFAAQGIPAHTRVRMLQDDADNLTRVDVRLCEFDYDANECAGPEGELAELTFGVRNFADRPAGFPAPPQSGPLYVTAVARGETGDDGDSDVTFEATGRMTDLRGLSFVNAGDLAAANVNVGGNQDLRVFVDADDIDIDGGDTSSGLVDVDLDMRVNKLPSPFNFCFAKNGRPIPTEAPDPITAACESADPFGDGTATLEPMTIAYDAPAPFDVIADVAIEGDLGLELPDSVPVDFGTFDRLAAHVALTDIPSDFVAYVGSPADQVAPLDDDGLRSTATRVRTVAPGATDTRLDLDVAITTEGVDCNDPNPIGGALCANVDVDQLPEYTSVLFATRADPGANDDPEDPERAADDKIVDQRIEFHACDRQFFAPIPACVPGTDGSIGAIDANVRAHAGDPLGDGVPPYVAPADEPHIVAQGAIVDLANFEVEAGLRVEDIRHLELRTNSDGMTASSDIGDGIDPLTVHAFVDTTNATTALLDDALRATALVDVVLDPLPQLLTFSQTGPGTDQADPVELDVTASAAALLTVNGEVREAGVAPDAACGVRGTYCAALRVDTLPQHVHGRIVREFDDIADDHTRDVRTRVTFLQEDDFDSDKADITLNAAVGLPFDAPIIGDGSVYADVALTGVPDHVSMGLDQHEVYENDDETLKASSMERVQVHTCERDFENEACVPGTEDQLDQVDVSARTFRLRPTDFPAPPAPADAPIYIGAAGRGNQLEAVLRIPAISEAQFLNRDGLTAGTARIGGTQPLTIDVDIQDLPLGELGDFLPFGELGIVDPTVSIDAAVAVTPFPGDLAFCMRNANLPMPAEITGLDFTAYCEETDPFDVDDDDEFDDDAGLTNTPLSIGFDANTSFDVDVDADVRIDGFDADNPAEALPTQHVFGNVDLDDIPSDLTLHFQQPVPETVDEDGPGGDAPVVVENGPFHGILRTPGSTSGVDLSLAAGYLVGADTICEDPRPNRSATCVSFGELDGPPGTEGIVNLPQEAEFFYNPDLDPYALTAAQLADADAMTNFTIHTEGTAATEFNTLRVSSVNPPIDLPALEVPLLGELSTDAFIAELDLDPLPNPFDLRGSVILTDESPTAFFEVLDGPSPGVDAIPGARVHVQNFLSPDPTAGAIVPDRPVEDDPSIDTYTISAFQRGPAVKVDAEIVQVQSFGLRPVRSGDPTSPHFRHPLGTTVVNAGFEGDFNIRAFVDLMPEPGFRIIGDVLIGDIPRETEVCVRGPRATETMLLPPEHPDNGLPIDDPPIAGTGTWCDNPSNVDFGEGALEIAQTPNTFGRRMDVDAFARLEFGGGASVLAGRVDIRQMPQIIRARFGGTTGKDVEVSTFSWGGLFGTTPVPDGINRIAFEAASFDLADADTGYVGQLPYDRLAGPIEAKPAPGGTGTFGPGVTQEFLHAAADLSAGTDTVENIGFHVRGQLGLDDETVESSQLQHFLYSGEPCAYIDDETGDLVGQAVPVDSLGNPRGDFPAIPENDPAGYTCIRADFANDVGEDENAEENELALDAFALLPGANVIRLHDAGISDLPSWLQVQIAEARKFTDLENQRGWRRPCPSFDDITADPARAGGCMAPLLRFDQPAETYLFGQAEFAQLADLPLFDHPSTDPVQPGPDFDAVPDGDGWANGSGGAFAEGIRLKVLDFDGGTVTNIDDDRIAARAGIRLRIPESLQVEQLQSYGLDLRQKNQDGEYIGGDKSQDMRLAFTVRDADGALDTSVGQLAAMVHLVDSGAQILLTKPCPSTADILDDQATEFRAPCAEYRQGINLPGHVALTIYLRNHLEDVTVGGEAKLRSSTFVQIDGRISAAMDIGARLYGNGVALLSGGPTSGIFTGDGQVTAGTAEVAIRNLPSNPSLGSHIYDPDFRFRTEIITDGDRPTDDPDPSTFSESGEVSEECNPDLPPEDPDGCLAEWFEFNFTYNIGIERAFVGFDMHPAGSATAAAKQLDAVIYLNTPKIGADLQAYTAIGGPNPAEISLGVGVAVSPLDFEVKSHSNIGANIDALVHRFITETIGAPDWLADIIGFIIKPITALIDAILNALPIGLELESDFFLQFSVDRLSRFQLRNNILHAFMDGEGDGQASFGPINWYIDKFSGGLYFDVPKISIPDWICWVPGIPCSIDPPAILLLGYGYLDGLPIGSLGLPIIMDFRDCDALGGVGSVIPFGGGGFDNAVTLDPGPDSNGFVEFLTGGDDEDFMLWVGSDPRMSIGGLLAHALDLFTGHAFSSALDLLVDVVVGPIVCHVDFFSIDQENGLFPGIEYGSSPGGTYHPGTENAALFSGHPVPGQSNTALRLPEGDETPPTGPINFPPPDPTVIPLPQPPDTPVGLDALYGGVDADISTDIALCGVHEFNSFDVLAGADITVATAANTANLAGDGPACPTGDEGSLEIRANTISVASTGSIRADAISDDIPNLVGDIPPEFDDLDPSQLDAFLNLYRATGSSGGTNAGVGSNGSAPEAAFQNYEGGTPDTNVYPGGPGSSVGTGFDLQSIDDPDGSVAQPDTVDSAGPGGLGGGTIVLLADTAITVNGAVTANGGAGASNTAGACDDDPDDNGIAGLQQHDADPDPDVVDLVDNAIVDPPYEHTAGFIGSGGGAGGGIAFEAERGTVTLGGSAVVQAIGGSGGSGRLGAGGGGGGGAIKVLAPIAAGVSNATLDTVGGADGSAASLCTGIPAAEPQTFDDPTTVAEEADLLPHDGAEVIVETPTVELRPYGPFWWAGGAGVPTGAGSFDAYLAGAAAPGTTLYLCAVRVPVGSSYDAAPDDGEFDIFFTPWDDTSDDPIPNSSDALAGALGRALPWQETVINENGTPDDSTDDFEQIVNHGTLPSSSAGNHCGAPTSAAEHTINTGSGSDALQLVEVSSAAFDGTHLTTPQLVTRAVDLNSTFLYGFYTVAIHGSAVETLEGVEWALGVDATRPNTEIEAPVDTPTPSLTVAGVQVNFVADDILRANRYLEGLTLANTEFILSGLNRTQCRVYASGDTPTEDLWRSCKTGDFHELAQPDGTKIIELRAFDSGAANVEGGGLVSSITADVDADGRDGTVDVILDIDPPDATLTFSGGTQGGAVDVSQYEEDDVEDMNLPGFTAPNWYGGAPTMTISDYADDSPSGLSPYVYRFDNGAERGCANEAIPDTTPPDCVLTSTEIADQLAIGGHTVHFSAVTESGNRYWDDNNILTPEFSPTRGMPTRTLYFDDEAPFVEVTSIPLTADQTFASEPWFSTATIPFVAAIDQFGGSGIAYIRAEFDDSTPDVTFNPNAPVAAPAGVHTFYYEVADVAGNVVSGSRVFRVDADPPALTMTPVGGTVGLGGWYTTAPTAFQAGGYDDNVPTGVGIDAGHFRTRVDNGFVVTGSAPTFDFDGGLTTGTHLVHAAAVDRFGNLSGEHTTEVRVDLEPPVIAPVIGPVDPDGENGWWHTAPFLTLFADDPGAGSGVDPAALQYSLDGGTTWLTWTEPVQVGGGEHTLCWRVRDLAGNLNPGGCKPFFVDLDDPITTITSPADPASGWFGGDVAISASSVDPGAPVTGSGFGAANSSAVCEDLTPPAAATNIAGSCVSVDGGEYRWYVDGTVIAAGEGIHTVRSFAVDRSGRRGAVAERIVHVDKSRPVVELRRLPRDPAESVTNWYRVRPLISLRADDGHEGSGVLSLEYRVKTGSGSFGPWTPYVQPFDLGNGIHTVETRATDMVGTATTSTVVKVDTTHPTAIPLQPQKVIWIRLLGLGGSNNLNFRVGDNLSGKLKVSVIIYDATQNPVRRLTTTMNVAPGTTATGFVTWDGKDGSLLNLVPLGVYYYRVVVVDEAGNVTQSGESQRITIRLL